MAVEHPNPYLSRREMLVVGGVLTVVAADNFKNILRNKPSHQVIEPAKPNMGSEDLIKSPSLFTDPDAERIARNANIGVADFFQFRKETLDSLTAYKDDRLYPIFPPAVHEQRELMYQLADEYSVPPNVIASIMSVESAGMTEARSNAAAQGLFQPLPDKFPSNIRGTKLMLDPYTNGRVGLGYFVNECLPKAQAFLSHLPPDHPSVYARALVGYNAGPGRIDNSYDTLPFETKLYADHMIRYFITAELAKGLRDEGFTDREIITKLISEEVDNRAYVLSQREHRRGWTGAEKFASYDETLKALTEPELNGSRAKLLQMHSAYRIPASPGLRIWLSLGGVSLFNRTPINNDLDAWKKITT